jgi:uncharacterized protein YkwD
MTFAPAPRDIRAAVAAPFLAAGVAVPFLAAAVVTLLVAAAVIALLAPAAIDAQQLDESASGGQVDVARVAAMIAEETNSFRKAHGLPPLEANEALGATAQKFAEYMARTGRYGHTVDGKQPAERIAAQGYAYCGVGENIAYTYRSTGFSASELGHTLVQGWIDSPPHRKNLLDPSFVELGVGLAQSAETGYYYAVQNFGRPKSATVEFSVANESTESVRYSVGSESFTIEPRYTRTHRLCREPALDFSLPGRRTRSRATKFTPETGDRFTISGSRGSLAVARR